MATLRLCQVSARGLAFEPDSRGVTGWPGQQNNGHTCLVRYAARRRHIRGDVVGLRRGWTGSVETRSRVTEPH